MFCARSMRVLSSQQPRFLNNLCAYVCLSDVCPAKTFKSSKPLTPGFIPYCRRTERGVPKRVQKITQLSSLLSGTSKKSTFWKKLRKTFCPARRYLGAEGAILKAHFAEGESLHPQFPSRELRAHLPRGSSLVWYTNLRIRATSFVKQPMYSE